MKSQIKLDIPDSTNDYVIENFSNLGSFWDETHQLFNTIFFADVYSTLELANKENINTEGLGFVRQLDNDEQCIFDCIANDL